MATYAVETYVDGPFFVKIPYEDLQKNWKPNNQLAALLPIREFISSWDQKKKESCQGD